MVSELTPWQPPELRISDADRERAIEHLRGAIGSGRLTLDEFEQRIEPIYQARTREELAPLLADVVPAYAGSDVVELSTKSGVLQRKGAWEVPRRLLLKVGSGSVKLDLTQAVITHPILTINVSVKSGIVTVVVPEGTTANLDGVEIRSGIVKSEVPAAGGSGPLHIKVTGHLRSGAFRVRHLRRFWRWSW